MQVRPGSYYLINWPLHVANICLTSASDIPELDRLVRVGRQIDKGSLVEAESSREPLRATDGSRSGSVDRQGFSQNNGAGYHCILAYCYDGLHVLSRSRQPIRVFLVRIPGRVWFCNNRVDARLCGQKSS